MRRVAGNHASKDMDINILTYTGEPSQAAPGGHEPSRLFAKQAGPPLGQTEPRGAATQPNQTARSRPSAEPNRAEPPLSLDRRVHVRNLQAEPSRAEPGRAAP